MPIRPLIAALALLPLAACGGGGEVANNSSDEATTVTEPVPDNAMDDPQNSVVPIAPAATPSPVAATAFPQPFRGRWGLTAADCDPAKADIAKGLLVVEPARLVFYESRGTPARIMIVSPTALDAELSFTGEGQQWTRHTRYTLLDAGKTLVAESDDPEPPMRNLRYARCPA